ncbi:MAG: DUF2520 domain-containing protein [Chitinophagaceae bacterium]|nr:DUF2520 domain-containing protein [Chitinophagaceae bacterium]
MNVILLGSGNTATALAKLMIQHEHRVVQVWSRSFANAQTLAGETGAEAIRSLSQITADADLCVLAVSDDAVADIAAQLHLRKSVLVHTAGSVSIDVLKNASLNYGVLYPLQSLRKEATSLPGIPFLTDGNTNEVKVMLYDFAKQLSGKVAFADDDQRLHMHLAAVMVSNFTNHLYAVTELFCKEHQLPFSMLLPLIQNVAGRLEDGNAFDLQTGPARRNDAATIQKHLDLLKNNEQLYQLYQTITNSILQMYHKKEELRL